MSSKNVHLIYFSPTGTTCRTLEAIAKGIAGTTGTTVNLTTATPTDMPSFSNNDMVLIGMPVYAGRLPALAVKRFKRLRGNGVSVAAVTVYGNRHYDDALRELYDLCREHGFRPVAAGAFIGEHSFSTSELPLSKGRPDQADLDKAEAFGRRIGTAELLPDQVPGNFPYKPMPPLTGSATSVNTDVCTKCGKCIEGCPTQGITMTENTAQADPDNCIWCLACLRFCPANARTLTHEKVKASAQKLNDLFSKRREPKTVIA